ncbi:MAG: hypothetical protein FJ030_17335 [Chloroflexi bacterium]|nr:hypothetical protein [Chloroflexota bacterium]
MLPPHETLPAHCFQLDGQHYLATGNGAGALAASGQGAFTPAHIRYAYPQLETRRPFFPAMAADDVGKLYRGLDSIDWLIANGLLFPRADVSGLWPDAAADQLFIKELDLAVPPLAFASPSESDFPGVPLTAAIEIIENTTFALAPDGNFPARLLSAIPAFQLNAAIPIHQSIRLIPQAVASAPRAIPFNSLGDLFPSPHP